MCVLIKKNKKQTHQKNKKNIDILQQHGAIYKLLFCSISSRAKNRSENPPCKRRMREKKMLLFNGCAFQKEAEAVRKDYSVCWGVVSTLGFDSTSPLGNFFFFSFAPTLLFYFIFNIHSIDIYKKPSKHHKTAHHFGYFSRIFRLLFLD